VTPHEPKLAALTAYAEKALSPDGRARVEKHLARCAGCRRALATIDVYRATAAEIREGEPPELDWSRMELALAREARSSAEVEPARRTPSYPGRHHAPVIALAAAAAALFVIDAWPEGARPAPRRARPAAVEIAQAPVPASATLVLGTILARERGVERPVEIGDSLAEGTEIATSASSELHVRTGEESGAIVEASTDVVLAQLREDEVALELRSGSLTVSSRSFTSGARFVVLAAAYRIEARATRFEVELDGDWDSRSPTERGDRVAVRLAEGEVLLHHPDGRVEILRAPATWPGAGGGVSDVGTPSPGGEAILRLEHGEIVRWEIGATSADGSGALAMAVRSGPIAIAGFDAHGRAFRTAAVVGADGLAIGGDTLVAEPPRISQGYLPPSQIDAVVRPAAPRVEQCFDRALRLDPRIPGGVYTLRFTVSMEGTVTRVRPLGRVPVPAPIVACIEQQAARWTFPPPAGGPVQFDQPFAVSVAGAPRRQP
jgi:hypothetical protein